MELDAFNSLTLDQVGIKLLPDERLEVAVELERGLTEQLENRHTSLLLTNKRLIRFSMGGQKVDTVSAGVEDVDLIEVRRTGKRRQWVCVGLVFIGGGVLLASLSLFQLSSPLSPLLMAVSLALIGIVFMLTYAGGTTGQVVVRSGIKEIKCRMKPKALDDMGVFVRRFYELKLGYAGDGISDGDTPEGNRDTSGQTRMETPETTPTPNAPSC